MSGPSANVVAVSNIREWFHESIHEALCGQRIEAGAETEYYIVNLLTGFARSEHFFERTAAGGYKAPALAPLFAHALQAPPGRERHQLLQRLGDFSLFMAGFFAESLARKPIDVDYYSGMGQAAYDALSELAAQSSQAQALSSVYRELAEKFRDFVDVLGEVAQMARVFSQKDVIRLYELWTLTGSKRAYQQLRKLGVLPFPNNAGQRAH